MKSEQSEIKNINKRLDDLVNAVNRLERTIAILENKLSYPVMPYETPKPIPSYPYNPYYMEDQWWRFPVTSTKPSENT